MVRKQKVAPGDQFVKAEDPATVWVVDHPVDMPGLPPHFYLTCHRPRRRTIMLAESALADRRLFRRVTGERSGTSERHWRRNDLDRIGGETE